MSDAHRCVLQVLPALESGGVERGTVEITEALTRAGFRALVISAGGALVKEIVACGGEHLTLPVGHKSLSTLGLVVQLRQFIRQENVHILHARSRWPAWIAWLAWRSLPSTARPHYVTTVHGFYRVNAYSAIMTRGERVICVSQAIREYVLKNYSRVKPERLVLIPRGIDRNRFEFGYRPGVDWQSRWHQDFPHLHGREILLLPGRITRLKGHHDFIRLIAGLHKAGRNIHGLILGAEDSNRRAYAKELRQAVTATGQGDRISFLGARADVREIMAGAQLVLSLSTQPESFGRTTLEALSLGRPVLAYAHGGVDEILRQLYPAGRVPVADKQALLDKAIQLLDNPVPVAPGTAYDLARMQAQTMALYQQLTP